MADKNDRQELQLRRAIRDAASDREELQARRALKDFMERRTPMDKFKEFGRGMMQGAAGWTQMIENNPMGASMRMIGAIKPEQKTLSDLIAPKPEQTLTERMREAATRGGPATSVINSGIQGLENRGVFNPQNPSSGYEVAGEIVSGGGGVGAIRKMAGIGMKRLMQTDVLPTLGAALAGGGAKESGAGTGGTLLASLVGAMGPNAVAMSPNLLRTALAGRAPARKAAQANIAARERQGLPLDIGSTTEGGAASSLQGSTLGLPGTVGLTRQQTEDVARAAEKRLHYLTGTEKTGAARAGRLYRSGFNRWLKGERKKFDEAYGIIDGRIAPDAQVGVANTRKAFDDLFALFDDNPDLANAWFNGGAKLRSMAQSLPEGEITYALLRGLRTETGRMLQNKQLMMEADGARIKQIYSALSKDIEAAARRHGGPALQRDVHKLNRQYRVFAEKGRLTTKKYIGQQGRTDTQIYRSIFGGAEPDVQSVRRALRTLPDDPKLKEEIIGIFMNRMGAPRGSEAGQLAGGVGFNPQSFITKWNNAFSKNQELKDTLFNATPRLRRYAKDMDELSHQIDMINSQAEVLANPSGTGAKGINMWTVYTVLGAITTGNLPATAASVGGIASTSHGIARLMTSPKFVNWVVKTPQVPAASFPGHIARLQAVMANDPEFEEETEAFIEQTLQLWQKVQQEQQ